MLSCSGVFLVVLSSTVPCPFRAFLTAALTACSSALALSLPTEKASICARCGSTLA